MNSKHKKTLDAVFTGPLPGKIPWQDIEALLRAVGAEMSEGSGSRVRFRKGEEKALFHRPHPRKEAKRYQVLEARAFLVRLGITP
ncbi:MAG: type II toxin-antitoxin system HicA family toxin [Pseudomonadota bacterium]